MTDTGTGIPEHAIPRLTERFYRGDKARSRAHAQRCGVPVLAATPARLPAILGGLIGYNILWTALRAMLLIGFGMLLGVRIDWGNVLLASGIVGMIVLAYLLIGFAARREWRDERFRDLYLPTTRERRQDVSVLFGDLEGFTSFSERHTPQEVTAMLNTYFERVIPPVVRRHGGDVDRLIGDAVINDGPGLMLIVEKLPWANTLDVTEGVEAALDELRPGLTGIDVDASIFRQRAAQLWDREARALDQLEQHGRGVDETARGLEVHPAGSVGEVALPVGLRGARGGAHAAITP